MKKTINAPTPNASGLLGSGTLEPSSTCITLEGRSPIPDDTIPM